MTGVKRKRKYQRKNPTSTTNRSSRIITKNFDIFVTDFLTDPCSLPAELRDCVLIDGTTSDICSSNNNQVLKKIFGNNETIDRDESSKKVNECEHRINV